MKVLEQHTQIMQCQSVAVMLCHDLHLLHPTLPKQSSSQAIAADDPAVYECDLDNGLMGRILIDDLMVN